MSANTPVNGAAGSKHQKGKAASAAKDPNAERYARLTKATVFIPAPIFNFTDFPDIYFEAAILGKDNDPKNKGCMVVKFTNYKDKYFFPLDALEEWVEKYNNVPRGQVRDFSTWGPELELNLRAGLPPPVAADSKPNSSSTGPDRKRKRDSGAGGGRVLGRSMLSPDELVGRDVAIPAPMLHKPGDQVYRGRVMAVHLTIPDDLLIMLYDDPAGVFQLGASEVARLLVPGGDAAVKPKKPAAAPATAHRPAAPKPAKKPSLPSGGGQQPAAADMEDAADGDGGAATAAEGDAAQPEHNNAAAAAAAAGGSNEAAAGEAAHAEAVDASAKVKDGAIGAAAGMQGSRAEDTLGVACRDQDMAPMEA